MVPLDLPPPPPPPPPDVVVASPPPPPAPVAARPVTAVTPGGAVNWCRPGTELTMLPEPGGLDAAPVVPCQADEAMAGSGSDPPNAVLDANPGAPVKVIAPALDRAEAISPDPELSSAG